MLPFQQPAECRFSGNLEVWLDLQKSGWRLRPAVSCGRGHRSSWLPDHHRPETDTDGNRSRPVCTVQAEECSHCEQRGPDACGSVPDDAIPAWILSTVVTATIHQIRGCVMDFCQENSRGLSGCQGYRIPAGRPSGVCRLPRGFPRQCASASRFSVKWMQGVAGASRWRSGC